MHWYREHQQLENPLALVFHEPGSLQKNTRVLDSMGIMESQSSKIQETKLPGKKVGLVTEAVLEQQGSLAVVSYQ